MSMRMKTTTYGAPPIQILATPDHYVNLGVTHKKATQGDPGLAVQGADGRWWVKGGTIYPANDATARGVVFTDYDVTDGDKQIAIVVHGFIKTAALPQVPAAAAVTALKQISFVPFAGTYTVAFEATTAATFAAGATTPTTKTVNVKLTNDLKFRDEAVTLTNWTFTGESTTKLTVSSIALSADKMTATLTITATSTALVAGSITAVPKVGAVGIGQVPGSALTVATVA